MYHSNNDIDSNEDERVERWSKLTVTLDKRQDFKIIFYVIEFSSAVISC